MKHQNMNHTFAEHSHAFENWSSSIPGRTHRTCTNILWMLKFENKNTPFFFLIPKRKLNFLHCRPIISNTLCIMSSWDPFRSRHRSRSPRQGENTRENASENDFTPPPFLYAGCEYRLSYEAEQRMLGVLGRSCDKDKNQLPIQMPTLTIPVNGWENEWQEWPINTHSNRWQESEQWGWHASGTWQEYDAQHYKRQHFPSMLSWLHNIKYPDGYFWTWHQKTNRSWTLMNNVWWTPYVHQNHANEPYIYWYSEEKWNNHSKFYINDFKYTSTNVDMDSNIAQSSSSHSWWSYHQSCFQFTNILTDCLQQ